MKKLYISLFIVGGVVVSSGNGYAFQGFLSSFKNLQQQNKIEKKAVVYPLTDKDLYYPGDGIGVSCKQSRQAYQLEAEKGSSEAVYHLAQLYLIGCGGRVDIKQAVSLYKKSAQQGNKSAVKMFKLIDGHDTQYVQALETNIQIIQNKAHQGNAKAQYQLGILYLFNMQVKDNQQKSFDWLGKSSQQGYLPALYEEGNLYFMGNGIPADPVKGKEIWKSVADTPFSNLELKAPLVKEAVNNAALKLGQVYFTGQGNIAKDEKKSFYYYQRAAKLGSQEGMHHIAMMYNQGIGVAKDLNKSQVLFDQLKE